MTDGPWQPPLGHCYPVLPLPTNQKCFYAVFRYFVVPPSRTTRYLILILVPKQPPLGHCYSFHPLPVRTGSSIFLWFSYPAPVQRLLFIVLAFIASCYSFVPSYVYHNTVITYQDW